MLTSSADRQGVVLEGLESRLLLAAAGDVIAFDRFHPAVFTDANGVTVTISLKGEGHGELNRNLAGNADAQVIELFGTNSRSRLTIQHKQRDYLTNVGQILTDNSLGTISAKGVNLTQLVDIAGSLTTLNLGSVNGFGGTATVRLHHDPTLSVLGSDTFSMTAGDVFDCNVLSPDVPVKSINVTRWGNVNSNIETIDVPSIDSLRTRGGKLVSGDFDCDLLLDTARARKATLGSVRIAGSLLGSQWDILGNLGTLNVGKWVESSSIQATGDMKSVTVGGSNHSDFLAGINTGLAGRHPTELRHFAFESSIKSFNVKGWAVAQGTDQRFYIDSNVAASKLGSVKLTNVQYDSNVNAYGLFAKSSNVGGEIKSARSTDKADKLMNWSYPTKQAVFSTPPMFTIGLVNLQGPHADAGVSGNVEANSQVVLDGTGSYCPNDGPLTYSWAQKSGAAVAIQNADQEMAGFTAPAALGQLVFELTVTNVQGQVAVATVTLEVIPVVANVPPQILNVQAKAQKPAGGDYGVLEADPANGDGVGASLNVYEGRSVTLSALGIDPDGLAVSYTWQQVGGKAATILNAGTSLATIVAPTMTPGDDVGAATLVFRVTVGDGEDTDFRDVTVRVRLLGDVNHDDVVDSIAGGADWLAIQNAISSSSTNIERYDLSGDGSIDLGDVVTAGANDGRSL